MPKSGGEQEIAGALLALDDRPGSHLDRAFAAFYPELKKIAHARLRGTGLQRSLQATVHVHDG